MQCSVAVRNLPLLVHWRGNALVLQVNYIILFKIVLTLEKRLHYPTEKKSPESILALHLNTTLTLTCFRKS